MIFQIAQFAQGENIYLSHLGALASPNFERTVDRIDKNDDRIHYFNSYFPDRKIVNFSHLSIHTSPEHPHYGDIGDFRQCVEDIGNKSLKEVYLGEAFGSGSNPSPTCRLTYNPRFEDMTDLLDEFLYSIE